jgi:hypothetical protein
MTYFKTNSTVSPATKFLFLKKTDHGANGRRGLMVGLGVVLAVEQRPAKQQFLQ